MDQLLTSKWNGLSPYLMASIYPVDRRGASIQGTPVVVTPITDATIEIAANWQSPYEQSGAESKAPFITALLQTGGVESVLSLIPERFRQGDGVLASLTKGVTDFSRSAENRSGMTKLNSMQTYSGSPPIRITLTTHFRAFEDPVAEVEEPVDQLIRWALAGELAPNGSIVSFIGNVVEGEFVKALLPSVAPQPIAFRYGRRLFAPMLIESISKPLTVPRSIRGRELHVSMQMSLTSLTSIDKNDWDRSRRSEPIRLFNNT